MNPGSALMFALLYVLLIFLQALMLVALNQQNPDREKDYTIKDIFLPLFVVGTFILPVVIPLLVVPYYMVKLSGKIKA